MQIYVHNPIQAIPVRVFFDEEFVSTHHVVEMYIYNLEFIMSKFDLNLNYYCQSTINLNLTIPIRYKFGHSDPCCVYAIFLLAG